MKLKKQLLTLLLVVGMIFSLSLTTFAASGNTTVYVTRTGEKYHSNGCQYLRKSQIAISLQDAVNSGYDACSRCNPPILTTSAPAPVPQTPAPTLQPTTAEEAANSLEEDYKIMDAVQHMYLVQFNTLMQTNPAAIDPLLTQRASLVMQLEQMSVEEYAEYSSLTYFTQLGLQRAGCFIGEFNGLMDTPTIQSIATFQQTFGLPATGILDALTFNLLLYVSQLPAAG